MKNLLLIILFFTGNIIYSQSCSVNAGGNATICGTTYTLQGSVGPNSTGIPTWTLVSKPAGAPDPVITGVNTLTPNVTGMTFPGNYVFQVSQSCTTGISTSQVALTAPGEVSAFTAGPDVTNIPATTGVATLNATIPNGYTASWTYYNIYSYEFSGLVNTTNATMSNTSTATPTLTLTNKANHEVDPAYRAVLRITSINNPSCWYEDSAIVRFIPNHAGIYPALYTQCMPHGTTGDSFFVDPNAGSPRFSTVTPNSAGNPSFGTTVTMAVVSQPSGGNIQYSRMVNGRLHFSGITTIGDYIFDLTVSNSTGNTTTRITYRYNGISPNFFSFIDAAHPNQMQSYTPGGSGGAVYCSSWIGSSTPITYYFKIDPADPATVVTTASIAGVIPSGGAPSIVQNGAGTMNRNVVLTPPAGGWRAGTYKISMTVGVSGCSRPQSYYVHISDSARPNVNVNNMTVCYPGSGVVSATIPLPAVYKTTAANPSYFQDFNGRYDITLVSRPAGAALPSYESETFRLLTSTSTVISNLDKQGEYVFRIKAVAGSSVAPFLDAEYGCSGTSLEDTFSIFVSAQVGANAGSAQNVSGNTTTLNGNDPGVATGAWTLVSKPAGATDPVIATPSAYNSNVTGFDTGGVYTFRWMVTTGTCTSTSDVNINITIVPQNYCVSGCNANSYVNSVDPNTIEYDNLISTFHASLAKEKDGTFKVWGQGSGSSAGDLLKPTVIAPSSTANENFNYTGTPLKVAAGSSTTSHQFALLTTDGLYAWGANNNLISSSIKSTNTFGKITIDSKADGLPAGVSPTDVKMMFGSYRTLAIVTCTGDAWVLSAHGSKNGDGTTQNTTNSAIWHRVKTSAAANANLSGVVAMRGTPNALFALTSSGNLYTWGTGTYINSGSSSARTYATLVTKPAGTTPKMIGMTQGGATASMPTSQTYYLLATDGKLFAMGNNSNRQLGNGNTTNSNTWIEVTATSGTNTLGGNIVWISPNEHSDYENSAAINVITNTNKQWGWGSNSGNMLGQNGGTYYDPIYMPGNSTATDGLNLTDEVVAVETGGHTTVNVKKCSQYFGYVGHKTNGSMGDETNGIGNPYLFSYSTSILIVCGTDVGPKVKDIKICENTTTNLNDVVLEADLDEIEWHATNDANSPTITDVTAVGPGTYYAFFSVASGKCRLVGSIVTISNYQSTDPEYGSCPVPYCYKPGITSGTALDTKVGITSLSRAGATDTDNWPMTRKGGWIALESQTKGFVPNRVEFNASGNPIGIPTANFVEGMMVFDTVNKCMKLYTSADGGATFAWYCISTQTCTDISVGGTSKP